MSQLIGKSVALMISDPWDFGTECGVGPFNGKITDFGTEKIADEDIERGLVELDRSISYLNTKYVSAICQVRHDGASLDNLKAGLDVSVNIALLPKKAKTLREISSNDFRDGFAALGSLQPR
jgi:hypothetical protein